MSNQEKETTEIQVLQTTSPAQMIQQMQSGQTPLPIEQMREALQLQKEWEANEARKAFNQAMARVHLKIPTIRKTKQNKQTNSVYAELDQIINETKAIYTAEGFSVSFYEGDGAPEGCVRICADVLHKFGHCVTRHYDVPLDGVGLKGNANMTKIHGKASSTSYGRRYLMCLIFNIPTGDDDDGNAAGHIKKPLSDQQRSTICDYMSDKGVSEANLCGFLSKASRREIKSLDDITEDLFATAVTSLKNVKKKEKKS